MQEQKLSWCRDPPHLPSPPTAGERGVSALCFVWRDGDAFAVEILDYH
jgi:hypothetical protein